ncbi:MAG: hypothetical protein HRU22_14135 [Gammaproteobacteria bacterium]|nr:hypothetical protein [Gammaproteobacteria bacterium]
MFNVFADDFCQSSTRLPELTTPYTKLKRAAETESASTSLKQKLATSEPYHR